MCVVRGRTCVSISPTSAGKDSTNSCISNKRSWVSWSGCMGNEMRVQKAAYVVAARSRCVSGGWRDRRSEFIMLRAERTAIAREEAGER